MAGIMKEYGESLERIRKDAAEAALTQNRASIWKNFAMIVALLLLAGCVALTRRKSVPHVSKRTPTVRLQ